MKSLLNESPLSTHILPELLDKASAKHAGLKYYFTGIPCLHGHVSTRLVINGQCKACQRISAKRSYDRDPDKRRKQTRESNERAAIRYANAIPPQEITCSGCKKTLPNDRFSSDRYRRSGKCVNCKKCVALEFARWKNTEGYPKRLRKAKTNRHAFKAADPMTHWSIVAWRGTKIRSKQRGCDQDLTPEWILTNANKLCPLLGIPLNYSATAAFGSTACIDRIRNKGGYTMDNCWVISMRANRIKTDATIAEIDLVAKNLRARLLADAESLV